MRSPHTGAQIATNDEAVPPPSPRGFEAACVAAHGLALNDPAYVEAAAKFEGALRLRSANLIEEYVVATQGAHATCSTIRRILTELAKMPEVADFIAKRVTLGTPSDKAFGASLQEALDDKDFLLNLPQEVKGLGAATIAETLSEVHLMCKRFFDTRSSWASFKEKSSSCDASLRLAQALQALLSDTGEEVNTTVETLVTLRAKAVSAAKARFDRVACGQDDGK